MITKLFSSSFLDEYVKEHDAFPRHVNVRCETVGELFACAVYLKSQGYHHVIMHYGIDRYEINAVRGAQATFLDRIDDTIEAIDMSKNFALHFYNDKEDGTSTVMLAKGTLVPTDTVLHSFLEDAFMKYKKYIRNVKVDAIELKQQLLSTRKGYNAFTKDCDAYLLPQYKDMATEFNAGTYLHNRGVQETDEKTGMGYVAFRVPGATRGTIVIHQDIVKDISFNEDTCFSKSIGCYDPKIKEEIPAKWIGQAWKVDYVGGYLDDNTENN